MKPMNSLLSYCYRLIAVLPALIALLAVQALAQNAERRQIAIDFPSTTYDINAVGQDLDHYYDNNHNYLNGYVLTGYNHYYNPQTMAGFDKANLTRLSSCGDVYWSRDLNLNIPNHDTRSASVRQTSDGGFILAGSVKHTTTFGWDILLVKTDQYANVQWYKRFNGFYAGDDHATSVREVYNPTTQTYDGFILTGAVDNYTDVNPASCSTQSYENATLVVIRTDVNGTMQWYETVKPNLFGCTPPQVIPDYHHYSYGHDIEQVVDANGNFINQFVVTGTVEDAVYYNYGQGCFAIPCLRGNKAALLMSITDNAGAGSVINWVQQYPRPTRNGTVGNTTGNSVLQTNNGFAVVGTTDFAGINPPDHDIYLLETDINGIHTSSRTYDAGAVERGLSIEVTADDYYVFGSFGALGPTGFVWDGLFTKIDRTTFAATPTERYGSTGFDVLDRSVPETGERFSVIGTTGSFTPNNAYYFLNNIGDDQFSECEGCSTPEELTMYGTVYEPTYVEYLQDDIHEYTEEGYFQLIDDETTVECECQTCATVNLTFQHGYGILDDRGYSLKETTLNDFILAGYTAGSELVNPDIFLYRAKDDGTGLWNATISESTAGGAPQLDERGFSVQLASSNGFVVAGDASTATDGSGYVVRTSNNGTPMWSMLFGREPTGTAYDDQFRSIKPADDNNNGSNDRSDGFVMAGFSEQLAPSPAFFYNGYIAKINVNAQGQNPTQPWGFVYGHDQDDYFMDIIQVDEDSDSFNDDGYLAVGFSNSTFGALPVGMGGYNIFITKVDENGNEQWSKLYGTDDDDVAYAIVQTDDDFDGQKDDGFIIVGATGTVNFTPTMEVDEVPLSTATNIYVLKIASDGTLEWSHIIDQVDDGVAYSVIQADDFSFVLTGDARLANLDVQPVMIKISQCGDGIVWARHYPDDPSVSIATDHSRELIQKSDGGYALFGTTCTYSGGGGGAAKGDFYLIKTDCVGDVCLSDALSLTLVNPGTIEHDVDPTVGYGPDDDIGNPVLLRQGVDYDICPDEEESTAPSPGNGVDLSWLIRKN